MSDGTLVGSAVGVGGTTGTVAVGISGVAAGVLICRFLSAGEAHAEQNTNKRKTRLIFNTKSHFHGDTNIMTEIQPEYNRRLTLSPYWFFPKTIG